jgi:4-hydroxy-tetrahydrodipicolinate reductase
VISLVVVGAAGRMGRAIEEAASAAGDVRIKSRIDQPDRMPRDPESGSWGTDLVAGLARGDVVIEFSGPAGAVAAARACVARGAALVSGTTGLSAAEEAEIRTAAERVAILRAANFSLGVLALRRALEAVLASAPVEWDIEIVERHHRGKVDSPSGTALQLARDVAEARGYPSDAVRIGRSGKVGPRSNREIGVHALRGGSWVGDHTVLFAGAGEWIELRHVAQDRGAFAHGAIAAARFVANAPAGLYTLRHIASAAVQ